MDNKNTLLIISTILEGTKKIVDNINDIIHNDPPSQINNPNSINNTDPKNIPCKYNINNKCIYGQNCSFKH